MKAASSDIKFPQMEAEIIRDWEHGKIFEKSNEQRKEAPQYSFYDGPPFANGKPHYGHLLANSIKDTVPRYWIMRGYYVERRFGWDCHGLPVEYEIEKREGLKGRSDILKMGIHKFNEMCRESVLHYTEEWRKVITRLGRWVDWNNQYLTMDKEFMESVFWVFNELHKKGLVYQSYKVVPYSPRITAVLSNFEANQNYKDVQDPAITIKFKAQGEDAFFLAWTTTPWTLVSNLALVVGKDIEYVKIKDHGTHETYYLAKSRLSSFYKEKKGDKSSYELIETLGGHELAGRRYEPLFPYFRTQKNAFQILTADYVTTEDGTGIVHTAPAYGEDDFYSCLNAHIELVDPLDEGACFDESISEYKGLFVKDADKLIIKNLKEQGKIFKHETIVHSYPYCDRTDSPLIYRAIPAWYVSVEKIKQGLIANNQTINWVPEHLRDGRMGKWLENARDWAISRNRFWGTPIPIWLCEKNEKHRICAGSIAEIEERSGKTITDLHKHFLDEVTFTCPDCGSIMRRIPEVFDCWFESGSMPYAQLHYPFENKTKFIKSFPADFIAEGLDQTRGWFYTLCVLSGALFDKPAFKNVVVNGMILAGDGRKMSKRWQNYTPPEELLETYGADSIRLYMLNSAVLRGGDLCFTNDGVKDTTRAVLLPLWNSFSFLSTYAQADGWHPETRLQLGHAPEVTGELDRWMISKYHTLIANVQEQMEAYLLYNVVPQVLNFIEDLTNWYIRLSRRRFWEGSDTLSKDSRDAYSTLYYVLLGFSKVFAPFAPFIAEHIYKSLVDGEPAALESVHLCTMPVAEQGFKDAVLEARMALARRVTELGRSLRSKHQIKTRQVLPGLLVITRNGEDKISIEKYADLIKSELNIKELDFSTDEAKYVRLSIKPNLRTLGKRLGKDLKSLVDFLSVLSGQHDEVAKLLTGLELNGSVSLLGHTLAAEDFFIERGPKDDRLIATENGVTVLLDTSLTEELVLEGLARELVNRIQKMRKESKFKVSDRISVEIAGDMRLIEAVKQNREYVEGEVLARDFLVRSAREAMTQSDFIESFAIDEFQCLIGVRVMT